jgi:hypothetical protein
MNAHIYYDESIKKWKVEDTDTKAVLDSFDTRPEALEYKMGLDGAIKYGASINKDNRGRIRNIRASANAIMAHTMALVPNEVDDPADMAGDTVLDQISKLAVPQANVNMGEAIGAIGKSMNLSYVKSLGLKQFDTASLAVKYVGVDTIRHPVFLWGSGDQTDVELEFFKRDSDFWDKYYQDFKRPLTWDHAQDGEWKDENPVIGMTLEFEDDDVGRWAISKLEQSRKYRKAVDSLIEQGILGSSSDSMPQYVIRQKSFNGKTWTKSGQTDLWVCEDGTAMKSAPKGATFLKRWPWVASALTDCPAEPRMIDSIEYFKSLGISLPEDPKSAKQRWEFMRMKAEALKLRNI